VEAEGTNDLGAVGWRVTPEDRGSASTFGPGQQPGRWAKAQLGLTKAPAYYAVSGARLLSFTPSQDLSAEGGAPADFLITGGPVQVDEVWLYSTDWYRGRTFLAEPSALANERRPVEPDTPPDAVTDQAIQSLGYRPSLGAYVYYSIAGPGVWVGGLSRTFLYDDILKRAGARTRYAPEPLADDPDTLAAYYQEGPYYVAHYVLNNPGGYLSQLEFKVYVRVWQG